MSIRVSTYYIGRLNIISAYSDDKEVFLTQGLTSQAHLPTKSYAWGFFEVDRLVREEEVYLHGFLVKYRPSESTEVVDISTREIEPSEFNDKVKVKSRFFLNVKSGILAYQILGDITDNVFRRSFCDLLRRAYDNFLVDVDIQTINHNVSFFESIRSLDSISKITISLHPSNPSNRKIWQKQDERLKALNIKTQTDIIRLKSDILVSKITSDEEINSKLHMASDGYGKARITGKSANEEKVVSTGDNPIKCKVELEAEKADSISDIAAQIMPTFKSIFNRMKDAL